MNGVPLKDSAWEYRPHYHGPICETGCNAVGINPSEAAYLYALFVSYLHESKRLLDLLWKEVSNG